MVGEQGVQDLGGPGERDVADPVFLAGLLNVFSAGPKGVVIEFEVGLEVAQFYGRS